MAVFDGASVGVSLQTCDTKPSGIVVAFAVYKVGHHDAAALPRDQRLCSCRLLPSLTPLLKQALLLVAAVWLAFMTRNGNALL